MEKELIKQIANCEIVSWLYVDFRLEGQSTWFPENAILHFTHKLVAMVTDFTLPDFDEVTSTYVKGVNFNLT